MAYSCSTALHCVQILHKLCIVSLALNCSVQTLYSSLWLCVDSVQTLNGSVQTLCRLSIALYRLCVDLYGSVQTLCRPIIALYRLCVDLYCSVQTLCSLKIALCRLCVDPKSLCVDSVYTFNTKKQHHQTNCWFKGNEIGFTKPTLRILKPTLSIQKLSS